MHANLSDFTSVTSARGAMHEYAALARSVRAVNAARVGARSHYAAPTYRQLSWLVGYFNATRGPRESYSDQCAANARAAGRRFVILRNAAHRIDCLEDYGSRAADQRFLREATLLDRAASRQHDEYIAVF